MTTEKNTPTVNFTELLDAAISDPGQIHKAYFAFHGYSLGNRILAYVQCKDRQIPIGPIASFNRWKELGRHVVKGAKAIQLCMPVTGKREDTDTGEVQTYQRFVYRRNWFVLAQTDGAAYELPTIPTWNQDRALAALDITPIAFAHDDGNVQGYARDRVVAVSPIAFDPFRTLIHECAHVLLGHTTDEKTMSDSDKTPRDIREVEAESVALLVGAALGLTAGAEYSRGYIQHWRGNGHPIPEASARKILKVADQILSAGRPAEPKETTK